MKDTRRMSLKLSETSTEEIIKVMRPRYARRGRQARVKLLDEFCQLCGYERKDTSKLLSGKRRGEDRVSGRSGSKPTYGDAERKVLKAIWLADEQPCGKRLKAAVPWLLGPEQLTCPFILFILDRRQGRQG